MKKVALIAVIGSALALTACASKGSADYAYENNAPYASERTVGADKAPVTKADRVYSSKQAK